MASTSAFQAEDAGSIPVTCSIFGDVPKLAEGAPLLRE